jgi:hypothetical protein
MRFTAEPVIGEVASLSIECADCGHSRWRKPAELYKKGIRADAPLEAVAKRLFCSSCREDGLPGKNVVVQAAFLTAESQKRAAAFAEARIQKVRAAG